MKNVENFTSRPTTRGGDPRNEVGNRLESTPERSSRLQNRKSRRERKTSHQNGFFLGPVRMLQFSVCFRCDGTAAVDWTRSRGTAMLSIIDRARRLTSPDNATRIFFPPLKFRSLHSQTELLRFSERLIVRAGFRRVANTPAGTNSSSWRNPTSSAPH